MRDTRKKCAGRKRNRTVDLKMTNERFTFPG